MTDSSPQILGGDAQMTTSSQDSILIPNGDGEPYSSVMNSCMSDYQQHRPVAPNNAQSQQGQAGLHTSTTINNASGFINDQVSSNLLPEAQPVADCYAAILTKTAKLEQALTREILTPPIDLVFEAEGDFCKLRKDLYTCTGHAHLAPPTPPYSSSSSNYVDYAHLPPHLLHNTTSHHRRDQPCLGSDRPVLLGLALLAERIVGMLEEMFRLAALSAHNMDKANQELFQWSAGFGGGPSSSARRLQRSFRSTLTPPCVSPIMEANRDLRIGTFVVLGQEKSKAIRRILGLRIRRMLRALEEMEGDRRARQKRGEQQGQSSSGGGPLLWGGSGTLLVNAADTLVDDLIRRVKALVGAVVLL